MLGRYAWDPAFTGFLNSPSWAVIGVLGIIFILLGPQAAAADRLRAVAFS